MIPDPLKPLLEVRDSAVASLAMSERICRLIRIQVELDQWSDAGQALFELAGQLDELATTLVRAEAERV